MKRILALLLALSMLLALTACSSEGATIICGNCAAKLPEFSQYCPSCGTLLFKNNTQSTTATPTSSAHTHSFSSATCTTPSKCECGEIAEEALGHNWGEATCTDTAVCLRCGESSGSALGHDWSDATCTSAKTCTRCNQTEGSALGHAWTNATCTAAKTCSRCSQTEGSALEHSYSAKITTEASCSNNGIKTFTCGGCGDSYTESFACKAYSATEIYDNNLGSVGEVITYDKNGNEYALGTCFVYSTDGKVITNYHVIDKAYSANILLGGATYPVQQVLAYDKNIDVAVLKISASGLTPVKLCTHSHSVGETVYAFGSSKGLTATFSDGIITYSGRVIEGVSYTQHDAPISSGNSGGPLINKYGEVIGINTWTVRDSQNLNFAINVSELSKLTYDTPLTMAQFYQKECDPFTSLKNYIIEMGSYYDSDDCYIMSCGVSYSGSSKYERKAYYYASDNTITLDFLINDGEDWVYFEIDENVDGSYYWMYFDENDYEMSGTLYAETYDDNTLLGYSSNNISSSDLRNTIRELASTMISRICQNIDADFAAIGVTAADLLFYCY